MANIPKDMYDNEKWYIWDRPKEITPTGTWLETKKVKFEKLPEPVQASFKEILEGDEVALDGTMKCVDCEGTGKLEGEECDMCEGAGSTELKVSFAQVMGGAKGVYQLGVHDGDSPVNPSGHDYYVRADGSFIGYHES